MRTGFASCRHRRRHPLLRPLTVRSIGCVTLLRSFGSQRADCARVLCASISFGACVRGMFEGMLKQLGVLNTPYQAHTVGVQHTMECNGAQGMFEGMIKQLLSKEFMFVTARPPTSCANGMGHVARCTPQSHVVSWYKRPGTAPAHCAYWHYRYPYWHDRYHYWHDRYPYWRDRHVRVCVCTHVHITHIH